MNLHQDMDVFSELVSQAAQHIGLPQVYVEKDYWVTNALRHLSQSEFFAHTVFKGGTSLSKAYKLIHRFSEDIDLAVFAADLSDGKRKKLLKDIERVVSTGLGAIDDARVSKGSSFRRTVYQYPRHIIGDDFGQASPELLIEVNSFTTPEPFETRSIQTLIADMLLEIGRKDIVDQFGLEAFTVNVLSVKRTLVEKLLGVVKDSYHEDPVSRLSNRIRHLYDICQILKIEEHQAFLTTDEFTILCGQCIEDEKSGFFDNVEHLDKPLEDAPIFSNFTNWIEPLNGVYTGAFSDLVYGDLPPINEIEASLAIVKSHLK